MTRNGDGIDELCDGAGGEVYALDAANNNASDDFGADRDKNELSGLQVEL